MLSKLIPCLLFLLFFKREPLFSFFLFFFEEEDKSVESNYFWIVATGKITGTLTRFEFLKTSIFTNDYENSRTIELIKFKLKLWIGPLDFEARPSVE